MTTLDFDRVYERRGTDSSKWHRHPDDVLPMFVADMDFRTPEPIIAALRERVEHGFFGYGRVDPELAPTLGAYLADRHAWEVPPDSLGLVPGVIAGFSLAVRALTRPGDALLMQTPAYPPIYNAPLRHDLERREAPLVRVGDRYEIDWDAFEAQAAGARVFLLCNPHNPTGRVFTRDELGRMAEICLRHGLDIIADEIHCDIVLDGRRHVPIASLDPAVAERTVTLMAPSKTFGLPGLKAAFSIITSATMRERLEEARAGLVPTVNVLGQRAMLAAYSDACTPWVRSLLAYLEANREFLLSFVGERLPGVDVVSPEGTYLAWLDCRAVGLEVEPGEFFLEHARVGVSNGLDFGPAGRGFTRLCFATPRSILADGLERMAAALALR